MSLSGLGFLCALRFLLQATLVSFVFEFALELGLLLAVRDVSGDEGSIAQIKVGHIFGKTFMSCMLKITWWNLYELNICCQ